MSSEQDGTDSIDFDRRDVLKVISLVGIVGVGSDTALADRRGQPLGTAGPVHRSRGAFPEVVPLPEGFQPEGIVTGRGSEFFVGSLASGAIYRGDLRTGEGDVLVSPASDRVAIGLSYDRRSDYLFVAGGPTGKAFVDDSETGETVTEYDLTDAKTFVNDVVVTSRAAYFTDSFRAFLYRVPLDRDGGLPDQDAVEEVPLGGDFESIPDAFNTNGIDAPPSGAFLIIVNSTSGHLYNVDPATGHASKIDLGDETVTAGDGILLDGNTLYVVRNQLNVIAVVRLEPGAAAGEVVGEISDPRFDVPTTIAEFERALYAVNARFGVKDPENAAYDVIRVPKRPNP